MLGEGGGGYRDILEEAKVVERAIAWICVLGNCREVADERIRWTASYFLFKVITEALQLSLFGEGKRFAGDVEPSR